MTRCGSDALRHRDLPYNGLAKTPPMGWNGWNHFQTDVDDSVVRSTADAMASNGMREVGYLYVNIDDSWQGHRDQKGNLRPNQKFPDMKALADYVHSKGLRLGIYSSPGPRTCAGYEGSYAHENQDAKTFAAWDIDYLKYDWCSADGDMRAAYQKMGEALQATGRPIVFSLSQNDKLAAENRVWEWGPTTGANLWRTETDISDSWESISKIGFSQNAFAPYAGPGHWNDPDTLEIGNGGLTLEENRTHMTLWSILAAPLLAGNDLRSVSPEILAILTNLEVIRIDQDQLGKEGTRALSLGDIEIWTRPLQGGSSAVAVFNLANHAESFEIPWASLNIPESARVRDLWNHADLPNTGSINLLQLPGHGAALFRVE